MATCRSSTSAGRSPVSIASAEEWGEEPPFRSSNGPAEVRRLTTAEPSSASLPQGCPRVPNAAAWNIGCQRLVAGSGQPPKSNRVAQSQPREAVRNDGHFPGVEAATRTMSLTPRNIATAWKRRPGELAQCLARSVIGGCMVPLSMAQKLRSGSDALPNAGRSRRSRQRSSSLRRKKRRFTDSESGCSCGSGFA